MGKPPYFARPLLTMGRQPSHADVDLIAKVAEVLARDDAAAWRLRTAIRRFAEAGSCQGLDQWLLAISPTPRGRH